MEKSLFLRDGLASIIGIGTRYDLEILRVCGESAKTISQKVLWAKTYICRSYMGKTAGLGGGGGGGSFFVSSSYPEYG